VATINPVKKKIDRSKKNWQNGFKEPLMCSECESKLSTLDREANKVFFRIIPNRTFVRIGPETWCRLEPKDYDYDKLRKFFISLVWRVSISSHPFNLGKYQDVALKILKGEIPDDENLFLPLIYRRYTGTNVDFMTAIAQDKFLGRSLCRFRFPHYEILVFTRTKNSTNDQWMSLYKKLFTRDNLIITLADFVNPLDRKLVNNLILSRGEPPKSKR
jgi:hypothetical protein